MYKLARPITQFIHNRIPTLSWPDHVLWSISYNRKIHVLFPGGGYIPMIAIRPLCIYVPVWLLWYIYIIIFPCHLELLSDIFTHHQGLKELPVCVVYFCFDLPQNEITVVCIVLLAFSVSGPLCGWPSSMLRIWCSPIMLSQLNCPNIFSSMISCAVIKYPFNISRLASTVYW